MPSPLFYIDRYRIQLPEGHKFPSGKYGMLHALLAQEPGFDLLPAPLAAQPAIELAHNPSYVKQFLRGELPAAAMRRIGFPWSEQLAQRSLASRRRLRQPHRTKRASPHEYLSKCARRIF